MKLFPLYLICSVLIISSCKKKGCTDVDALNYNAEAKKDDGSCTFLETPNTYSFTDASSNSTVSYSGQTDRLNQLEELTTYMKTGTSTALNSVNLNEMFHNTGGNGGGSFSFSSTKQLANKCFPSDSVEYMAWFDSLAAASVDYDSVATNGQAGTLTSGTSTYLFDANGFEYAQLIEKGLMGAILLYQANQIYFGDGKMNVDNITAVDAGGGKHYTEMEHHWDEAFGYFGVATDFPSNLTDIRFWGKYCNSRNTQLGCNATIMNAFKRGRAAISEDQLDIRDAQILIIRQTWERVCAAQAAAYLEEAQGYMFNDQAKYLHSMSEACAFIKCLTYVPLETRIVSFSNIDLWLNTNIGDNLWNVQPIDISVVKGEINNAYGF